MPFLLCSRFTFGRTALWLHSLCLTQLTGTPPWRFAFSARPVPFPLSEQKISNGPQCSYFKLSHGICPAFQHNQLWSKIMIRSRRRSPLKTIRMFCLECQGSSSIAVKECRDTTCPFQPHRYGTLPKVKGHQPMKAIRNYCLAYCQFGSRKEVINCEGDNAMSGPCPLFPFRLGVNPNITPETREKRRQAALRHDPLRVLKIKISLHQTSFDGPQSTQKGEKESRSPFSKTGLI